MLMANCTAEFGKEKREMEEKRCLGEKEVILVQAVNGQRSDFYIVDLKAEEVLTTPINALVDKYGLGEMARVGSVLYNVGGKTSVADLVPPSVYGDYHVHVGASCLELSTEHLHSLRQDGDNYKWKDAPRMKHARTGHSCAALGGKLYALGGTVAKTSICEVLDPQLGYWTEVPPPPSDIPLEWCCVSSPVIPDEKNERLLVHLRNVCSLYAYYPSTATWDCLDKSFRRRLPATTALIDDVLYFHIEGAFDCLNAYDLSSKAWLKIVYSPNFCVNIRCSYFQGMLHLGNGMLCLCEFRPCNLRNPPVVTKLRFVKFRVQRISPGEVLVAYDSVKCFSFDGYFVANNFIRL